MTNSVGRRTLGKWAWIVIILAVGIGAVVVAVVVGGGSGGSSGGSAGLQFKCESCGHEWTQVPGTEVKCPKCGAYGVTESWFACPRCKEVFVGLEVQKVGVGKTRCRLPGQKEWRTAPPDKLTCSKCGLHSALIWRYSVRDPNLEPLDEAEAARRRRDSR